MEIECVDVGCHILTDTDFGIGVIKSADQADLFSIAQADNERDKWRLKFFRRAEIMPGSGPAEHFPAGVHFLPSVVPAAAFWTPEDRGPVDSATIGARLNANFARFQSCEIGFVSARRVFGPGFTHLDVSFPGRTRSGVA